jgi:hypothetical protein
VGFDLRAAGVCPADVASELVECVADASVHRLPEHPITAVVVPEQVGVRPGGVQTYRRFESRAITADLKVGHHVIDTDEGDFERPGQRSRGGSNDPETRTESGATREGDSVECLARRSIR